MDHVKFSRLCAIGALLVTNSLYSQGTVKYSWQGPVEILPDVPPLGSNTGELRFRESKAFGLEYVSLRAVVSQSTSYRMVLPPSIGVVDYCVKRGATTVDGDGVNSIPLRFDVCAAGATEWLTATHDSANQHLSTVYTNNVLDYADWVVRRSRGTEAAPADTNIGDFIAGTSYLARVGGTFKPQVSITSKRVTPIVSATAVADWRLTMYTAAGVAQDKIMVSDNVYLGTDFGSIYSRVPKIWVQDFDCAGTGCPSGTEWISATNDASNNHVSTVYSNNAGDRVGWRVLRSRGTEASPLDTLVGDVIAQESYEALIGGGVFPVFQVQVQRLANAATSRGAMTFRTFDNAGTFYDKLVISEDVTVQNSNLLFTTDMAHSIGTSTGGRPLTVYAQNFSAMTAGGSSYTGAGITPTSIAVATTGGVATGIWTASTGAIWASGGYSAGTFPGSVGITGVFSVSGCSLTIQGGIIINRTC